MVLTTKQWLLVIAVTIGLIGGSVGVTTLAHSCDGKYEVDVSHSGEITCDLDGSKLEVQVTCDCTGQFNIQGPPAPIVETPVVETPCDTPCDTIEIVPVWSIGAGVGADAYMVLGEYHFTPTWSVFASGVHTAYDDTVSSGYWDKTTNVSGDDTYFLVGAKWTQYKQVAQPVGP